MHSKTTTSLTRIPLFLLVHALLKISRYKNQLLNSELSFTLSSEFTFHQFNIIHPTLCEDKITYSVGIFGVK